MLGITVSQSYRQENLLGNHLLLGTAQPEEVVESNYKEYFLLIH